MPDLLGKPRRFEKWRDVPSEDAYIAEPAKKHKAKALFMDASQMTSLRHLTPTLGRAVVQNVHFLESPTHDENAEKFSVIVGTVIGRVSSHGHVRYLRLGDDQIVNRPSHVEDFLDRARRLDERGRTDSALDVIYNHVDEMLLAGKFSEVDDRLASTNCDKYSADLLLALLTITYAAKKLLPHRQELYARVAQSIRDRDEWEDGLLCGLE